MGVVSVPGMSLEKGVLRRRGLIAVAVVVVVILVIWLVDSLWPKNQFTLTLRSPNVAAGIIDGAPVKLNGLQVGKVSDVKSLGHGVQGVVLTMNPDQVKGITNSVEAAFSAGNLFGVSEVELIPHGGGDALRNGEEITPQLPITDNTVSNIITTLGDVNNDAIRPHMSEIMNNVDLSTSAMLPLITALGTVAQSVQDTQRLSTSQTFPVIARVLGGADQTVSSLLPALSNDFEFQPVHDQAWVANAIGTEDAISNHTDSLSARLEQILNPSSVKGLSQATPVLVDTLTPLLTYFPNAGALGIKIGQLLDNIRSGMPNTPNGPVLNVNLSIDYPAVGAMLPPVTFQVVPHGTPAGPNPGGSRPSPGAQPSVGRTPVAKPTDTAAPATGSGQASPTSTAKAGN
ncbi:hypothetical protein GCM10023147_39020 [Tsukamurella soli]|uniref:Mce/MlaD domain-containing protein n=1 Tax=Tsukamurella soli TaxID=644556 RepID=A0ABP8K5P0_9ACTN